MMLRNLAWSVVIVFVWTAGVRADDICLTSSGSWKTAGNWDLNRLPNASDKAYIGRGLSANIPSGSPGTVYADIVYVGAKYSSSYAGNGRLTLEANSSAVFDVLYVADDDYTGTFVMGGEQSNLFADQIVVGKGGNGTFEQNGGSIAGMSGDRVQYWKVGDESDTTSTYTMTGGTIDANVGRIGYGAGCRGTMDQSGGTVDFGSYLRLGSGYSNSSGPGQGTYTLDSGCTLLAKSIETIDGVGTINQNGTAIVSITEELALATSLCTTNPSATLGTYNLKSGHLTADVEYIGQVGKGVFNHIMGGTNEANAIYLGYESGSDGTYNIPILGDGTVNVGELLVGVNGYGYLNVGDPECHITIATKWGFGTDSRFEMAVSSPGCPIRMVGAEFENKSTDPAALSGLVETRLIYDGDVETAAPFEVAGNDLGALAAGFAGNFVLGALQVGSAEGEGHIQLVDAFDNSLASASPEALYVEELTLNPGATIDLNGLHLYFLNGGAPKEFFVGDANLDGQVGAADASIVAANWGRSGADWSVGDFDGSGVVDQGDLILLAQSWGGVTVGSAGAINGAVPEPSALTLLLGLLLLACQCRRLCPSGKRA